MTQVLSLMNQTRGIVTATRDIEIKGTDRKGLNVELGNYFSLYGYNTAQLFGVNPDNKLYKVQSFVVYGKWFCSISVKNDFVFNKKVFDNVDTRAKINPKGFVELNEIQEKIFIDALSVKDWDEQYNISEADEIPDIQYENCIPIYSPILSF